MSEPTTPLIPPTPEFDEQEAADKLEAVFKRAAESGSPSTPSSGAGDGVTAEVEPEGEGGDSMGSESPPDPAPTPEPTPEPTLTDLYEIDYEGHQVKLTPDQLREAIRIHDWTVAVPADAWTAFNGILNGTLKVVPAESPASPTSALPPAQTAPSPDEQEEWVDPRAAEEIAALRAELQQVKESVNPVVQGRIQDERTQIVSSIDSATKAFADEMKLSDQELEAITKTATESGLFPTLYQRHGGDAAKATTELYSMIYWNDPTYRGRSIQAAASEQIGEQQEQETADKKRHLTALSGSGGSVPRREPAPATREERMKAATEEIKQAMSQ